jgi:alpha-L-rhamnosidase
MKLKDIGRVIRYLLMIWAFLSLIISTNANGQNFGKLKVANLRCNNMMNPEGIELPVLSWKIYSEAENVSQSAYEIEIATSQELLSKSKADVWKSGKVHADKQFRIKPEGANFFSATPYWWRVRIWDASNHLSKWSEHAYFSYGLPDDKAWSAKWITRSWDDGYTMPYFRKVIDLKSFQKVRPVRAFVFLCALGNGELYINGKHIDSTRLFDPAITNYDQYAFYTAFDVTDKLRNGENCIGVMLGKGWFTQDEIWAPGGLPYGNPMLRLQIVVIYNDGTRKVFGTDDSWTWKDGPVVKCNVYRGEMYDARLEIKDWATVNTPGINWNKAIYATKNTPPKLVSQQIEPIRKTQELTPVKMWKNKSGNWVYDFGINTAAIPKLKVKQPAGTHLVMKMAEGINSDSTLNYETYAPGLVGIQIDEYICNGKGEEVWMPRFTYHAFRYIELSGIVSNPDLSWLKSVIVHNDFVRTGKFECSDAQINKLHELAVRTALSNMHHIPEDCPQREKSGWGGDAICWAKMAANNFDLNNFWMKYTEDIRSSAAPEMKNTLFHERHNTTFYYRDKPAGIPLMLSPGKRFCGVAAPQWGSAYVFFPWYLYVYYGNKDVLSEYYPGMKQWVNHIAATARDTSLTNKYNPKVNSKHIVYQGLGDWCPPDFKQDTPIELFSTMFVFNDVSLLEKIARIIGKTDDAVKFAMDKDQIKGELLEFFYDDRNKTFGSQAADAVALDFGLVPQSDEQAVSDAIVRNMNEKYSGFMHVGNYGISRIGGALAQYGNSEAAFNMFTKKGDHSFAWMWEKCDATTLWEVLPINSNSKNSGDSFNSTMSYNHPAQSGYDISFFEDILGIRPDIEFPGYKTIRFQPKYFDHLSWAKGSIETMYGTVGSNWKRDNGNITWEIEIPSNSTGLVELPSGRIVKVDGVLIEMKKIVLAVKLDKTNLYHFPSGKFEIEIK